MLCSELKNKINVKYIFYITLYNVLYYWKSLGFCKIFKTKLILLFSKDALYWYCMVSAKISSTVFKIHDNNNNNNNNV